jgi:hypothetical protein
MHKLDTARMILEADRDDILARMQRGASLRTQALSLLAPARFRLDRITPADAAGLQSQVKAFAARLSQWEADIDAEGVRPRYLPLLTKMHDTRKRAQAVLDARTVAQLGNAKQSV